MNNMFYLLEDNRIIDSNNLPACWRWYKAIKFDEENKKISFICPDPRDRHSFKIKKQSENVFDLIETGDLVAQKKMFGCEEIDNISLVCSKDDKLINCFYCAIFEDKVCAIYKPNSKGDYIKVWERKE